MTAIPCKDIKRYRRRARERFLSPDEIRRVVEVLNRYDGTRPLPRRPLSGYCY